MSKRVRPQRVFPTKWDLWKARANSPEWVDERAKRERARASFEVFATYARYRIGESDDVPACPSDGVGPADGEPGIRPPLALVSMSRKVQWSWPRAEPVFRFVERIIPARVAREEIGDAEELIQRMACDPDCRHVRARVSWVAFRTCVVVLKNALAYIAKRALFGQKTD